MLVLVIPDDEKVSRATLARSPWIDRDLEIYTFDLAAVEYGKSVVVSAQPIEKRSRVLQLYRDDPPGGWGYGIGAPPRPTDHEVVLNEKLAWVADFTEWLETRDEIYTEHTEHYLAWRCAGTIVLKMTPGKHHVTIAAGIQHSRTGPLPLKVDCTGVLTETKRSELEGRVLEAVGSFPDGLAERYREHRLQGVIAGQHPPILGLDPPLKSERAAWRPYPPDGRAFLDFLGVDHQGVLHIIETKVGEDAMMVLQGLDYWIWATANRDGLATEFGLRNGVSAVEVDFLVDGGKGKLLGPYSKAQSLALADEVVHRFWEIRDWESGHEPAIDRLTFG